MRGVSVILCLSLSQSTLIKVTPLMPRRPMSYLVPNEDVQNSAASDLVTR